MKSFRSKGFSLVELMVAVVIVGILAKVAMPSFSSQAIRAARAAAQTELLGLASLQEKIYLNSNAYVYSVTAGYNGTTSGGLGNATGRTADSKYLFSVSGTGQTYTLTAIPATGIQQTADGCLTIQENGLRQWYQKVDACTGAATPW
jgi:type IV pilus assembly protein PilE